MLTNTIELNETALKREVAFYPVEAASIKIETEEDHDMACEFLATVREKIKEVNAMFALPKANAKATHQAIVDLEKLILSKPKRADEILTEEIKRYRRVIEEKRKFEEARLLKEQEEEKRRVAEELQNRGVPVAAKEVLESKPKPVSVSIPKPSTNSIASKANWKFEVVDESLVPDEFWVIDEGKLGAKVREIKDTGQIPGVRIFDAGTLALNTKK